MNKRRIHKNSDKFYESTKEINLNNTEGKKQTLKRASWKFVKIENQFYVLKLN